MKPIDLSTGRPCGPFDDPTDLAAIDEEALEAERLRQAAQTQHRDDVRWLMAHAQGRRLMWGWLSSGGIYRTTFVPGASDSGAFNEGRRAHALELFTDMIEHAPASYAKMREEAGK